MIEHHIDIATADGAMNSFVVHPEEGGPHPVVLFYMDAPGKREELHDMARRIASVGYFVVLPNLYYRRTRDFFLTERTEALMAHMFGLMATLDGATTRCDTQAMLDFVAGQALVLSCSAVIAKRGSLATSSSSCLSSACTSLTRWRRKSVSRIATRFL